MTRTASVTALASALLLSSGAAVAQQPEALSTSTPTPRPATPPGVNSSAPASSAPEAESPTRAAASPGIPLTATSPVPPEAPPPPQHATSPAAVVTSRDSVHVVVDGATEGVWLYRLDDTRLWISGDFELESWELVCRAPCGVPISTSDTFRVMGPGILPSDSFMLRGTNRAAAVQLTVDPGSPTVRSTTQLIGWVALAAAAGLALPTTAMEGDERTGVALAGGAFAGVALAMFLVVPLINKTSVAARPIKPSRAAKVTSDGIRF